MSTDLVIIIFLILFLIHGLLVSFWTGEGGSHGVLQIEKPEDNNEQ